jgi:hypothetical protein
MSAFTLRDADKLVRAVYVSREKHYPENAMTPALPLLRFAVAALFLAPVAAFAGTDVPIEHFGQIALHGGGHVTVKHGAKQRVTLIKGSTQYTRFSIGNGDHLFIYACNDNCPQHYDLEIEIVTPVLNSASIQGGGEIDATGTFPSQAGFAAAIDGGGDIDVHAISAGSVQAAVNGGGRIFVTATGKLVGAVSGGGEIVYNGNPNVTKAINGGGSVEPAGH